MRIGVIAGGGTLPSHIVERCKKQDWPVFIVGINGYFDETILQSPVDVCHASLGQIGRVLNFFKFNYVTHICFAGDVRRPDFSRLNLDSTGAKWLLRLGRTIFQGDDALLRRLLDFFEQEGFAPISVTDILPDLLLKNGNYGAIISDQLILEDIKKAEEVLDNLSTSDVGQSVIIQNGQILGIEAAEGTSELIKRCSEYRTTEGGLLVKKAKKEQSLYADLPTVGLETVDLIIQYQYRGLAICPFTQVIDKEEFIATCKENNLIFKVF